MATCRDCIHYDVCAINGIDVENTTFKKELCCGEFINKTKVESKLKELNENE